jgi:hypothetical protein
MENALENLSILRKFALQLVSAQKDKLCSKKRLYKAALDIGYLKKIIQFYAVAIVFLSKCIIYIKTSLSLRRTLMQIEGITV